MDHHGARLPQRDHRPACAPLMVTSEVLNPIRAYSNPRQAAGTAHRGAGALKPWRRRDLNPQPPPCKGGALPVELRPRLQARQARPAATQEVGVVASRQRSASLLAER